MNEDKTAKITKPARSNNVDNLKEDDREDEIEETNNIHDVKSHVKKQPIMTVTFPKKYATNQEHKKETAQLT